MEQGRNGAVWLFRRADDPPRGFYRASAAQRRVSLLRKSRHRRRCRDCCQRKTAGAARIFRPTECNPRERSPVQQVTINFEAGQVESYKTCREFVASLVHKQNRPRNTTRLIWTTVLPICPASCHKPLMTLAASRSTILKNLLKRPATPGRCCIWLKNS